MTELEAAFPIGAAAGARYPASLAQMVDSKKGRYSVNKRRRAGMVLVLLVCRASVATAQRGRFFYGWDESVQNIPYDGRFTFVRVRYTPAPGGNWAGGRPSWVHGYPSPNRT